MGHPEKINQPPLKEGEIQRLNALARWLDYGFRVPGTSWRFGLDALIGLIPGVGDVATLITSLYPSIVARRYKLSWRLQGRLMRRVLTDAIAGTIPILGDLFDLTYKANQKNVEDLLSHVAPRSTDVEIQDYIDVKASSTSPQTGR